MGNQDETVQVSYPSVQATWMKGEINVTIRGEEVNKVIADLGRAVTEIHAQIAFKGDKATQPVVNTASGEKCLKCGSVMNLETKQKKDGSGEYQILICTNTGCNTNESNGKFYRTSRFPKRK